MNLLYYIYVSLTNLYRAKFRISSTILCGTYLLSLGLVAKLTYSETNAVNHTVIVDQNTNIPSLRQELTFFNVIDDPQDALLNYVKELVSFGNPNRIDSASAAKPRDLSPPTALFLSKESGPNQVKSSEKISTTPAFHKDYSTVILSADSLPVTDRPEPNWHPVNFTGLHSPPSYPFEPDIVQLEPDIEPAPEPEVIDDDSGWEDTYLLTFYCLRGRMSSGRFVYSGAVAADKSIFSLGTELIIEGLGEFTVEDRFAWDARTKRLDIWVPTCNEAIQRGVEYRRVKVLTQ